MKKNPASTAGSDLAFLLFFFFSLLFVIRLSFAAALGPSLREGRPWRQVQIGASTHALQHREPGQAY
jgi:hypothetical protein